MTKKKSPAKKRSKKKSPAKKRLRTAPPPITPVRGNSWVRSKPPRIEVPLYWPVHYPKQLLDETRLIIAEAVKVFPTQELIIPLCRSVITQLTPVLMSELRPDGVVQYMDEVIHCLLVANYRNDNKRYRLQQDIHSLDEWRAMLAAVVQANRSTATETVLTRDRRIDEYLLGISKSPSKPEFSREQFWTVAGVDPADGRRWQRDDPNTSKRTSQRIERALEMPRDEFLRKLTPPKRA